MIEQLSKDLKSEFPEMKGFSTRNLKYMSQFAELYPDLEIGQQPVAQLPWGHIVFLMNFVQSPEKREFYMQNAIEYGWSRNILEIQIETNLFERQGAAITNFSERLPSPQSDLANETLKNPYNFDFLSLGKEAHEREIEKGLVQHIEKFLLEMGDGFAYMGRQYPICIDEEEYFLDMLFYNVKLRCYVVLELKAGKFKPANVGQLNFYLSAVDDLMRHPSDNPTIGILLCKSKVGVSAEYALRNVNSPIGISEYRLTESLPEQFKTALPSIEELEFVFSKHALEIESLDKTDEEKE